MLQVPQVFKERQVQLVQLGLLVQLELQASPEHLVFKEHPVLREVLVLLELQASLELVVSKEHPVLREVLDLLVPPEPREVQDLSVLQVRPASLEHQEFKALLEVLDQQVLSVQRVLPVHQVFRAHLEVREALDL